MEAELLFPLVLPPFPDVPLSYTLYNSDAYDRYRAARNAGLPTDGILDNKELYDLAITIKPFPSNPVVEDIVTCRIGTIEEKFPPVVLPIPISLSRWKVTGYELNGVANAGRAVGGEYTIEFQKKRIFVVTAKAKITLSSNGQVVEATGKRYLRIWYTTSIAKYRIISVTPVVHGPPGVEVDPAP